ncbi:hypothetical protein LCGC14_1342630, partial [marine sediment metagenome]
MRPEVLAINVKCMRRNNPYFTLRQIGGRYGVTGERVRQILRAADMPTKAVGCLKRFSCLNCGRVQSSKWRASTHLFCSFKCRKEYTTIDVACPQCGVLFQLYRSQILA